MLIRCNKNVQVVIGDGGSVGIGWGGVSGSEDKDEERVVKVMNVSKAGNDNADESQPRR